ncbi:winged helix domain-containing protein [Mesorhizobium sp. A556]
MSDKLRLIAKIEPDSGVHEVIGRDAWALKNLMEAGKRGCTPIDHPGPRWSHYVYKLRGMGFIIETVHEEHAGPFAGTHARYVLHSVVTIRQEIGRAA